MDKRWLNFLIFLPLLILIPAINFLVDPAMLFCAQEDLWADSIIAGNITYVGSENHNRYKIKELLIEKLPKEVDCLVFGPSLSFEITGEQTGVDKFYNLSVSGLDINGLLAQLGSLEYNNVKAKKIIFSIDTFLFDEKIYSDPKRNRRVISYADYMQNILDNKPNNIQPRVQENNFKIFRRYMRDIYSLTYFQSSVKYLFYKQSDVKKAFRSEVRPKDFNRYDIEGPAYDADGSYIYPPEYKTKMAEDVISNIKLDDDNFRKGLAANNGGFTPDEHISEYSKNMFEKIIKYYTDRGVKIELFVCPVPPYYWDILNKSNYPILHEQEEFAKELAKKYNLSITGTMNPYAMGIKDEDFYDARHISYDALVKHFDFKK